MKTTGGADYCSDMDSDAENVLLILGDSHASVWFNEMAVAARKHGLRLVLSTAKGCPAIDVDVRPGAGGTSIEDCRKWHAGRRGLIDDLQPKGVIVVETDDYLGSILDASGKTPDEDAQVGLWKAGLSSSVDEMKHAGIPVGFILDNPKLSESATTCIARERSVETCRTPRTDAMDPIQALRAVEIDVAARDGIATLDPVPVLCGEDRCLLGVDGKILYVDDNHLSNAGTKLFPDETERLVAQVAD